MTIRDTPWPAGTPCWVDLMTNDLDAARLFYEQLFDWQLEDTGPDGGGYVMATLQGRYVAGLGPTMGDDPGHPPVWNTYLATEDAAATCEKVTAAGGSVFVPPMPVMDAGVMAVCQDAVGGSFGLWQAGKHFGVQLANEPNSLTWNEQLSRDYERAKQFYSDVFGYTFSELGGGEFQYAAIEVGGTTVGGIGTLADDVPPDVPAHWRSYFAVDDADDTVDRAVRAGATVLTPPRDMPYGRHADIADPTGAAFSVIKGADPS
ncbi:MAG: uncharacterized protein QOE97_1146 [Pseudonocardiales bacterium]|nr:uncharacterized protein [Pseudonocardiales bacterium]